MWAGHFSHFTVANWGSAEDGTPVTPTTTRVWATHGQPRAIRHMSYPRPGQAGRRRRQPDFPHVMAGTERTQGDTV